MNSKLQRIGMDIRTARSVLATAMWQAETAAVKAAASGTPEAQIARELGVDRMTVRKWLGKL